MKVLKLALALCVLALACTKTPTPFPNPYPYKGPYGHPPPPPPPQEYNPSITSFYQHEGIAGDYVVILGQHFGETDTANIVKFNGTTAEILFASTDSLFVSVPDGVSTGKITVTVKGKTATSVEDFVVLVLQGWKQKPNFPSYSRAMSASFVVSGKAYLYGGMSGVTNGTMGPLKNSDLWEYDPVYDRWSQKLYYAFLPTQYTSSPGRFGSVGFAIGNKGYIGLGNSNSQEEYDLWEYDPSTNQSTQKADFPGNPRESAVVFVIGKKAYVGLGKDDREYDKPVYNDFYVYDQTTDHWTRIKDFPGNARGAASAVALGSYGYVIGDNYGSIVGDNGFWRYDPSSDTWSQLPPFPGSSRGGMELLVVKNKIYAGFGSGAIEEYSGPHNDFYVYDPQTTQWSRLEDCPGYNHLRGISFVFGNRAFVATGGTDSAQIATGQFWQYVP